jgi:hypothetical protein
MPFSNRRALAPVTNSGAPNYSQGGTYILCPRETAAAIENRTRHRGAKPPLADGTYHGEEEMGSSPGFLGNPFWKHVPSLRDSGDPGATR